jgi:hypothetical protein
VVISLIIIAVYILIQYILDYFSNQDSTYLFGVNILVLLIPAILLFFFGFRQESLALTQYSSGIMYVHFALIAETIVLFVLSVIFKGKKIAYLAGIIALTLGGLLIIQILSLLNIVIDQMLGMVFGVSVYSVAVVETLPWTLAGAWENFTIALILMVAASWFWYTPFKEKNQPVGFPVNLVCGHASSHTIPAIPVLFYRQCGFCCPRYVSWNL